MKVIGIDRNDKKRSVFVLKQGVVVIQINEEEAGNLCKSLADYLNLNLLEKDKLNILRAKANKNSTKKSL